jgi:hypothetical protein
VRLHIISEYGGSTMKRSGITMSDDERALVGAKHRANSEPAADRFDDDLTPVGIIIERIESDIGDELNPRERRIVQAFGRHTANMEMRARKRRDTGDTAALEQRVDAIETAIVDISGRGGNNGKLGALKARVDAAEARRWWGVTFLAGLVVAALGFAFSFGSRLGAIETQIQIIRKGMP